MSFNEKLKKFRTMVIRELKENRSTFFVYTGMRLLVLGILILQIFNENYENVFLCILTLFLMILPSVVQATFKVEFPSLLEVVILCFIFAAEILGEVSSFYIKFPYWDTILHTINGFLCAAIGFSLVDIMNRDSRIRFELSPLFMAITAFCFSMTIGVLWEFFEFAVDSVWGLDMQKDTVVDEIHSTLLDSTKSNHCVNFYDIKKVMIDERPLGVSGYLDIGLIDTMYDMVVNFIGAFLFSVLGYIYVKHRDTTSLLKGLIPEPWSKEKRMSSKGNDKKSEE